MFAWFGADWVIRKAGSTSARGNASASGQTSSPLMFLSRLTAVAEKSRRQLHPRDHTAHPDERLRPATGPQERRTQAGRV